MKKDYTNRDLFEFKRFIEDILRLMNKNQKSALMYRKRIDEYFELPDNVQLRLCALIYDKLIKSTETKEASIDIALLLKLVENETLVQIQAQQTIDKIRKQCIDSVTYRDSSLEELKDDGYSRIKE